MCILSESVSFLPQNPRSGRSWLTKILPCQNWYWEYQIGTGSTNWYWESPVANLKFSQLETSSFLTAKKPAGKGRDSKKVSLQ